jgi:pyruvate/2-oxoglutarate dehydrogenase complex dihydrolipoamide acyltransferase (E2) component
MFFFLSKGDELKAGDGLAEIETDKAVVTFEQVEDGFLARILVPDATQDIAVGRPVAITVEERDDIAAFATYTPSDPTTAAVVAPVVAAVAPIAIPVAVLKAPSPVAIAKAPSPVAIAPVIVASPKLASPVAAPSSAQDYYAFEAWGSSLTRSPLAAQLAQVR